MYVLAVAFLLRAVATASPAPQIWGGNWGSYDQTTAVPVEDPDPHQKYHYKQISNVGDCSDGPCENAFNDLKSYSIGFQGDLGGAGWITGDFAVSEEKQTGTLHNCQSAKDEQDILCVFWRTAMTGYTVQNYKHTLTQEATEGEKDGEPYVLWSPNDPAIGSGYVCGRGDNLCKYQGYELEGSARPKGEPQSYPFDEDFR
ncbi:hypothetical protein DL771_007352 [Monosporascus sp. 5C6A]|nr:hypothetical protein DL771_007352 [Monosporascus sp. 5C6A]